MIANIKTGKDALFAGWFGPIGVAALYYSSFALRQTGLESVWTFSTLIIFSSIVFHGITDSPFTKLYAQTGLKQLNNENN